MNCNPLQSTHMVQKTKTNQKNENSKNNPWTAKRHPQKKSHWNLSSGTIKQQSTMAIPSLRTSTALLLALLSIISVVESRSNTNHVYSPCGDASVQRSDGFTFGIAFSQRSSFFFNNNNSLQLSPCDRRLALANSNSQLAVFRPKVDEISLLTINTSSNFFPVPFLTHSHFQLIDWFIYDCCCCLVNFDWLLCLWISHIEKPVVDYYSLAWL